MARKPFCPRFFPEKVECIGDDCALYVSVMGMNPNTGEEGLKHGCADAWKTTLLIEQSRTQRGTTQAIESFRNEIVKAMSGVMLLGELKKRLIEAKAQGKLEEVVEGLKRDSIPAETVENPHLSEEEKKQIEDVEVTE